MKLLIGLALIATSLLATNAQAGEPNEHRVLIRWVPIPHTCEWQLIIFMDDMQRKEKVPKEVTCKPNLTINWKKEVEHE